MTPRLVLRCWDPRDAPLLKDAIDSSLNHLRPWMPWARHEPQTLAQKVELLREFRGQFDLGADSIYGIFDAGEERVLGGTGLHPRIGTGGLEIGYWIRVSAAIPRKLAYSLQEPAGDDLVFTLTAAEFPESPAASARIQ